MTGKDKRGFASMNPDKQREIARKGGRAPHDAPRGFAAMSEQRRKEIARKGGKASHGGGRPKRDEE